jgi:hypothetical protein
MGQTANRINKAKALSNYTQQQILDLRFNENDKYHGNQTLQQWIEGDVAKQLKDYILSADIVELAGGLLIRGYIVVIVGSRHIITRAMNRSGELDHKHYLIGDDNSDDEYGSVDFDDIDIDVMVSGQ